MARTGWGVYLLRCGDGSLYTGVTNNLPRRLAAHNAGRGGAYTRSHRPVRVVYWEAPLTRSRALRREHQIKSISRSKKEVLIQKGPTLLAPPRRPRCRRHGRKTNLRSRR